MHFCMQWGLDLGPRTSGIKICMFYYRSEGFPLTGLFHPWAQWDLGLDTLENSSRRAVAAVALGGTNLLPTFRRTTFRRTTFRRTTYLPTNLHA